MIKFDNWRLETCPSAPTIGRQYDHLSRRLEVTGELPEGWDWAMLVRCGDDEDTILLEPMEGGVGADLTEDNLSQGGYYALQLRGTLRSDGITRRHTNIIQVFVPESLAGHGAWPEVPTEFDQLEKRTREQADRAEAAASHYPTVGDDGNWMIWDVEAGAYVDSGIYSGGEAPYIGDNNHWYVGGEDTGVSANGRPGPKGDPFTYEDFTPEQLARLTGPIGPTGGPGPTGPDGKAATVEVVGVETLPAGQPTEVINEGTENAAKLRFKLPAGPKGETGTTPQIAVQVTQLAAGAQPTAEVTGTAEAPVIRLGIPRGDTGAPGTDGADGQTPNITIGTVETLPAGSAVTATITGQTPDLVLNLGIPQGGKGDPGTGVPDITEADEGKVVGVVDGQLDFMDAPPLGASAGYKQSATVTLSEDARSIIISNDDNGDSIVIGEEIEMIIDPVIESNQNLVVQLSKEIDRNVNYVAYSALLKATGDRIYIHAKRTYAEPGWVAEFGVNVVMNGGATLTKKALARRADWETNPVVSVKVPADGVYLSTQSTNFLAGTKIYVRCK